MGVDDFCQTSLALGLGLSSPPSSGAQKSNMPAAAQNLNYLAKLSEPSLTLSLFSEISDQTTRPVKKVDFDFRKVSSNDGQSADLYGQDSAASSFSAVSVKREREMGSDDTETRKVTSRVSDEDDDGSNGRKKLRLTKAQSALLEGSFKHHSTLSPKQKQDLARELKLRPRQVEVWFQNRRARTKLKQTEVDCELLKKCCETLTNENRRLLKELQELKSLKLSQPLYMQLPAATLTICPSCERIGGGVPENTAKSPFAVASKPHFYNPFANQSAAC